MTEKEHKTLPCTLKIAAVLCVVAAVIVLVVAIKVRQDKDTLMSEQQENREARQELDEAIEIADLGWKWRIRDYMKTQDADTIRIIGWKAEKVGEQLYLVSYTFDDGSGEKGWFMEVNVTGGSALNIFAAPERMERYGISMVDEHIGKRSADSP